MQVTGTSTTPCKTNNQKKNLSVSTFVKKMVKFIKIFSPITHMQNENDFSSFLFHCYQRQFILFYIKRKFFEIVKFKVEKDVFILNMRNFIT